MVLMVHAGIPAAARTTPQPIGPGSIGPIGTTLPGAKGTQGADGTPGFGNNGNDAPGTAGSTVNLEVVTGTTITGTGGIAFHVGTHGAPVAVEAPE